MIPGVFVTGTDTDCGKTFVAAALIRQLKDDGLRVACLKPVAAGAEVRDGFLQNDDTLALCAAAASTASYQDANPYCFAPPVSPHIAAAEVAVEIRAERILEAARTVSEGSDFLLVEGAGGWRVPLSEDLDIQGLAVTLGLPVVLTVGLRLGCLNHALLSEQAILAAGLPLRGWIGTQIDPDMARLDQNIATLRTRLESPCLGLIYRDGVAGDGRSFLDTAALRAGG